MQFVDGQGRAGAQKMSIRTQEQYSSYAALTSASRFSLSPGMSSHRPTRSHHQDSGDDELVCISQKILFVLLDTTDAQTEAGNVMWLLVRNYGITELRSPKSATRRAGARCGQRGREVYFDLPRHISATGVIRPSGSTWCLSGSATSRRLGMCAASSLRRRIEGQKGVVLGRISKLARSIQNPTVVGPALIRDSGILLLHRLCRLHLGVDAEVGIVLYHLCRHVAHLRLHHMYGDAPPRCLA